MNARFVVFAPRSAAPPRTHYLSAYDTFRSVWSETYRAIHGDAYVSHSNDFTRQDYIQALFEGELCVGLDCVRKIRLDNPADLDDSWLGPWPAEILDALQRDHAEALINSCFTVHRDYRKHDGRSGHPVSYLLGCLSVLHQLETGAPLMLGMMRCDRSMNKLGDALGATTLRMTTYNGKETALVAFERDRVRQAAATFPDVALRLFENRVEDRQSCSSYEREPDRQDCLSSTTTLEEVQA
ncbi:MAG TPA: hypothetical protein VF266_10735 [Thermoanaerobaculia bacterium]